MFLPISQIEYVTYTRTLNEIKIVEQCCRKEEVSRLKFVEGKITKIPKESINIIQYPYPELKEELKSRVKSINDLHSRLLHRELTNSFSDDCTALVAEYYNSHLKTISTWNEIFTSEDLQIILPNSELTPLKPLFTTTTTQVADEKALNLYFELLEKYPKLKRPAELNDYKKGTYEVVYDKTKISEIQKECYQRLFTKLKSQGFSDSAAHEQATSFSRPGVVCEDQFWLWIRDVVIAPQGYKHTYNRIVWKSDLDRIGGAATLPIIVEDGIEKIIVQLAFRHATNSWELEIPRGGSKPNETSSDTAKREILEETGYVTDNLVALGNLTPDSGLTASIVPVFLGKVIAEKETRYDKTEAIKNKFAFTLSELLEGFKKGFIEIDIDGNITPVPLRDPFLAYALLMAQSNNDLSLNP